MLGPIVANHAATGHGYLAIALALIEQGLPEAFQADAFTGHDEAEVERAMGSVPVFGDQAGRGVCVVALRKAMEIPEDRRLPIVVPGADGIFQQKRLDADAAAHEVVELFRSGERDAEAPLAERFHKP